MYGTKKTRLLRIEARRRPVAEPPVDRSRWDWYAPSCSCGLPPGECREHPRGRPSQRPPVGDWRVWGYVAGRGAGKTRAGACWMQHRVEAGVMKLGCLIAPTMADIRDVMVEGPSGLLAVAPPWCQPRFEDEQVFGSRFVNRWPRHLVLDGLETLDLLLESGNLLIHPRCTHLRDAFGTYSRKRRGGEWIDYPADSHPEEDMIDALRGGARNAFPEGLVPRPNLQPVNASRILGCALALRSIFARGSRHGRYKR